jgi:hypothetical protein
LRWALLLLLLLLLLPLLLLAATMVGCRHSWLLLVAQSCLARTRLIGIVKAIEPVCHRDELPRP